MNQDGEASTPHGSSAGAHQGLEFRHLRYLVAVADAGTFTHAAERMFVAQPTLSQQIRRLEEMVGTPLLQRRRDGVRLTPTGTGPAPQPMTRGSRHCATSGPGSGSLIRRCGTRCR